MKKALLLLLFLGALPTFAQSPARFDLPVVTTTAAQVPPGTLPNLLAVANATISVCQYPAVMSNGMCTNTITTYTDSTLATACPSTAQLTAPGTSVCISTTGLQGAFGFWYNAATQTHMTYTISTSWGNFGPYDILQGGESGGGSGTVTNFSSQASVAPLFSTSVSNATTTPALSFTLGSFGAHTFYGNNTGSTATPGADLIGASDWSPNDYAIGSGSAQAQSVTLSPAPPTLAAGLEVRWLPIAANTGAGATLNVNGLGAVTITKTGISALAADDLTTTAIADAIYDGTYWQLLNPQTSSGGGGSCPEGTCIVNAPSAAQTITLNTNGANTLTLANPNAGSSATSGYSASNGTDFFDLEIAGTGTGSPGAAAFVMSNMTAPLAFQTAGGPILFNAPNTNISGALNYAADTGAANAYVVAPPGCVSAILGTTINFEAANASTGASTLAYCTSSPVTFYKNGSTSLTTGDILAGAQYSARYDGTNWQLLNSSAGGSGSLPTATAANQVPAASGAGTTYTAQTIPNAFFASSTTPLYTFCHFRDDSDGLWISYSTDGNNWQEAQISAANLSATIRDPSCMYVPSTGTFYFVATSNGVSATGIAYWTSTDLQNFTAITYPVVNSSALSVYAPEFFLDPVSGNYYVIAAPSLTSTTRVPYIAQFTPSTGSFGTWSQIALTGTQAGYSQDFFLFYANSKYYLYYSDLTSSGAPPETLSYATSTTLTGTYTQVNTAGTSFVSGIVGNVEEGPTVYTLPNGNTQIVFDTQEGPPFGYHPMQSVNSDGTLTTWTTAAYTNIAKSEQGTVVSLTANAPAQVIFNLALSRPSNSFPSGFGINTATPGPYADLQVNSRLNGTGINSNIPGSIALDADASDTFPYKHSGYIEGCYGTYGGSTCPVPSNGLLGGIVVGGSVISTAGIDVTGNGIEVVPSSTSLVYNSNFFELQGFGANTTTWPDFYLATRNSNQTTNVFYLHCTYNSGAPICTFPSSIVAGSSGQFVVSTTGDVTTPSLNGVTLVASTTTTVGTTAIAANTCTSATTVTMTGVATSSTFTFTPSSDVSGVTGWGSSGGLTIDAWPTANTLNYKVCNQTAASITPSASVTFNVSAR